VIAVTTKMLILFVLAPQRAELSDADADEAARVRGSGQITAYDFEADNVEGLVVRDEGVPVPARMRERFPTLLKIRGHFIPELVRMAKDV
jgi:hypothetical protein